jgi:hypothetical protein
MLTHHASNVDLPLKHGKGLKIPRGQPLAGSSPAPREAQPLVAALSHIQRWPELSTTRGHSQTYANKSRTDRVLLRFSSRRTAKVGARVTLPDSARYSTDGNRRRIAFSV